MRTTEMAEGKVERLVRSSLTNASRRKARLRGPHVAPRTGLPLLVRGINSKVSGMPI